MIDAWIGVLTKPEETMASEKAKASLMGGIINFAIAFIILGIIMGIGVGLIAALSSVIPGMGAIAGTLGLIAVVAVPIAMLIVGVIGTLILNLLCWIAAKIVGGSGSFGTQYYMFSLLAVPAVVGYLVAIIIFIALAIIPIIGAIIGILVMYLIMGYLSIVLVAAYISAMKEAHGFATMNVALATGIGYVIIAIIVLAIILIFAAAMMPMLPLPPTMFAGLV